MARPYTVGILSDVHYASAAEQARGLDYELQGLKNPLQRLFVRYYRRYFWLRDPMHQNHRLDRFLEKAQDLDYLVVNGDYSCNSAFVGLSDDAAFQSTRECLGKLLDKFGAHLYATYGDHEL